MSICVCVCYIHIYIYICIKYVEVDVDACICKGMHVHINGDKMSERVPHTPVCLRAVDVRCLDDETVPFHSTLGLGC